MKKFLVIFLAIVAVLAVAVSAIAFVPKVVNESKVNQLSSGGVKIGETVFSVSDSFEGSVNMTEDKKIEFCFTDISGHTDFVKEKAHLFLIGEYSVGLDKNITIDVEECYVILELVGDEKNKEEYIKFHTMNQKDRLDNGNITLEEYNKEIARINGEKYYPNEDATITSAKLRMDTESGKVYLLSYKSKTFTVEFSYYESGAIKSQTVKTMGLISSYIAEYDEKGNQLQENSEREFYDNGVIKKETVVDNNPTDGLLTTVYEYDSNGRLVKSVRTSIFSDTTYEYIYNSDGILVLVKDYTNSKVEDDNKQYSEFQYIGYQHDVYVSYSGGQKTLATEYYGNKLLKETHYSYDDNGTLWGTTEKKFKDNGDYESISYNKNGVKDCVEYFSKDTDTLTTTYYDGSKISYKTITNNYTDGGYKTAYYNSKDFLIYEKVYKYENGRDIKTYYDTNGKRIQETISDSNGNVTKTYYHEDGSIAPYPTFCDYFSDDKYVFERYRYDGNIVEHIIYNEYGKKEYSYKHNMNEWNPPNVDMDGIIE